MFCAFKDEGNNLKKCVKCGFSLVSVELPERIFKQCTKDAPSIVEKASNFVHTMVDFAKSGFEVSTDERAKARLDICQGTDTTPKCDQFENGACKLCGCHMPAKVKVAAGVCPLGKW